jgi:undecaprenyl-phosphate galactose phosphotransferase
VSDFDIERVILADPNIPEGERLELLRELRANDVQLDLVPHPFESFGPRATVHMLDGIPLVGLSPMGLSRSSLFVKRTMDIVLSAAGLFVLLPVLAFVALMIKLDSRGPVFYWHERIGRNERRFRLLKFRTMYAKYCRGIGYGGDSAEEEFDRLMQDSALRAEYEGNHKLRSDPRVTKIGAFLRATSMDELPQLVNVLRGDLSLVGPRPIVTEELDRYGSQIQMLLSLRPGVTGYWQINGRSDTSYSERVRLDLAYANNWSLQLDLIILVHTVRLLISRPRGAY